MHRLRSARRPLDQVVLRGLRRGVAEDDDAAGGVGYIAAAGDVDGESVELAVGGFRAVLRLAASRGWGR